MSQAIFHNKQQASHVQRSNITRKRRLGNFFCSYCGKHFNQKCNLKSHVDGVHLNIRGLRCPYPDSVLSGRSCTFRTAHPSSLTKHKIREHGYVPKRRNPRRSRNSSPSEEPASLFSISQRYTPYQQTSPSYAHTINTPTEFELPTPAMAVQADNFYSAAMNPVAWVPYWQNVINNPAFAPSPPAYNNTLLGAGLPDLQLGITNLPTGAATPVPYYYFNNYTPSPSPLQMPSPGSFNMFPISPAYSNTSLETGWQSTQASPAPFAYSSLPYAYPSPSECIQDVCEIPPSEDPFWAGYCPEQLY